MLSTNNGEPTTLTERSFFRFSKSFVSKILSMYYNHIKLLAALLSTSFCANAQDAIPATGGDATGSGGSASYTVGQVGYNNNTGINGSVAEGVQQAYVVIPTFGKELTSISLSAFPNPTTDLLTLQVDNSNIDKLSFELYDMQGKIILRNNVTNNSTAIDMNNLPTATYFLKVAKKGTSIKTFKIIKS